MDTSRPASIDGKKTTMPLICGTCGFCDSHNVLFWPTQYLLEAVLVFTVTTQARIVSTGATSTEAKLIQLVAFLVYKLARTSRGGEKMVTTNESAH